MNIEHFLSDTISTVVNSLFDLTSKPEDIILQKTKKEFEGDFTLVTFPYIKAAKATPEKTGELIGEAILKANPTITTYNVVKGFLNFSLSNDFWVSEFKSLSKTLNYGIKEANSSGRQIMLEYSSPNTHKPLHLGHVRNNLLGYSVATILKTQGHEVVKVNLVNDRGIHICKSMLSWLKFGNGETPESSGLKGDHLVGKYYVEYDKWTKQEIEIATELAISTFNINKKVRSTGEIIELISTIVELTSTVYQIFKKTNKKIIFNELDKRNIASGDINLISIWNDLKEGTASDIEKNITRIQQNIDPEKFKYKLVGDERKDFDNILEEAISQLDSVREVKEMLLKWEAGDPDTIALWTKMNNWVYDGFKVSYKKLGVEFDKTYYESNTYLLGKEIIQEGLDKNIFYKKENNSVAIDLTADKLDEKIVLRSDGTSVYITQDLGTAIERFKEYPKTQQMIYTVGNEQDYHFKVLFKILEKLGYDWAKECYHLSYGMVELPEGKMKSREGTVVDADDLMDGMVETARETTEASGKVEQFPQEEKDELFNTIGMGALKYFILKVDPKKKMLFDPKESIDLHGNTGPFIQYAHARIKSILRDYNAPTDQISIADTIQLHEKERELIKLQYDFPKILEESANTYNPAVVANYIYELAKLFNQFYNECSVLKEQDLSIKQFRVKLVETTANIIKNGMLCLGVNVPERM